ncbi:MAG: hotdog fold thioesterase [Deltaproteobacteria bacterium]|nr:hotdog fold thioesterase [Deltaproteobacteria bacterium]
MDEALLVKFFEEQIPFNLHLGMKVERLGEGGVRLRVPFADHLVGDPFRPALHGGVTSALADTAGGLAVFARVGLLTCRVATVDLRVDYYLPARLCDVVAEAEVVRIGNRVGVARILVRQPGDDGQLGEPIAEGKGVYSIIKLRG